MIYLIGSLRNPRVPEVAKALRKEGFDAYDEWWAPGHETDDYWQKYEKDRGRNYAEALAGWHARHVFEADKQHLDEADGGILLLPAGKSGHLELGYLIGQGKPGFILMMDGEPERYDIMYKFANGIFYTLEELLPELERRGLDEGRGIRHGILRGGNLTATKGLRESTGQAAEGVPGGGQEGSRIPNGFLDQPTYDGVASCGGSVLQAPREPQPGYPTPRHASEARRVGGSPIH